MHKYQSMNNYAIRFLCTKHETGHSPRDKPDYHVHLSPQTETGAGRENGRKVSPDGNTGRRSVVNACEPDGTCGLERFHERAAAR
jgi:hypothetical protein